MSLFGLLLPPSFLFGQSPPVGEPTVMRIVIQNEGWGLVGDLTLPAGSGAVPAVLLLNQADGDRTPYEGLADALAVRGIASLRLDLRGRTDRTVVDVTAAVLEQSESADVELLSGRGHATNLLTARRDLADRIASWFWARFILEAH